MTRLIVLLLADLFGGAAWCGDVQVAVAANFAQPMQQIAAAFEQETGNRVTFSAGATGKFYAQIRNAAPFDVLLSADQATPGKLIMEQQALAETRFTYAVGKLVLWSADPQLVDDHGQILASGHYRHLALASPEQAPYGQAAIETLTSLKLLDKLAPKFVQGESIGQTYAFVATGNAELGFVALSQVWENNKIKSGSVWMVPEELYQPLRQDAVLLRHGKDNPAARGFLEFLKSDAARKIIRTYGYQI